MSLKKFGISTVVYGIGGVFNRAVALLLLPFLTHVLSKHDYGVAGMMQIASFFVIHVFSLGVGGSLSACYFKQSGAEYRRSTVTSALALMAVSAALLLLILLPNAKWIAEHYLGNAELAPVVIMSGFINAFTIVCQPLILRLQFEGRSATFVVLAAITSLTTSALIVAAVVGFRLGLMGWIGAQLIGQLFSLSVYGASFIRSGIGRALRPILGELIRMGIPVVPSFLFIYVITQGNRYCVEFFLGVEQLGVFSVASSLAASVTLAVTAFQNAWIPFFMGYREDRQAARAIFGEVTSCYFLIMGACAALFFSFAQPVMTLITEESFHYGWVAIGSVASAYVLSGAMNLLAPAQYFSGKLWHLTIMQGIAAAFSIWLNWWWIRAGGLLGAGAALAVSFLFLFVLHVIWNRLEFSMSLPVDYNWKRIILVCGAVVVIAGVTVSFPASSVVSGLIRGAGISLACVAGVWMALSPRERAGIGSLLGNRLFRRAA